MGNWDWPTSEVSSPSLAESLATPRPAQHLSPRPGAIGSVSGTVADSRRGDLAAAGPPVRGNGADLATPITAAAIPQRFARRV